MTVFFYYNNELQLLIKLIVLLLRYVNLSFNLTIILLIIIKK